MSSLCLVSLSLSLSSLGCGGSKPAQESGGDTSSSEASTGSESGSEGGEDDQSTCELGETLFDESTVHELALTLSDADWAAMIAEAEASPEYGGPDKTYFEASFELDGVALGSPIALRLKGHSSLLSAAEEGHSFPFKVDIDRVDPNQDLEGLSKLNLHPNLEGITSINEYLSYGAIRAHGVPTARMGFVRVTLNGEALGLYSVVEHMQGKFVRCHFGEPHGDLYKPEEPIGNLAWQGSSIADYEPEIQFKWPKPSLSDHASLLNLLDVINHQEVAAFASVLQIDEVLTYLAVNVGVGNYDYYASFGHNYYLYESTPGVFTMLPWDMNFSQTAIESPCGLGRNSEEWPISNKLLGDSAHTQQYLAALESFLMGAASAANLHQRLDMVLPVLGSDVNLDAVEELRAAIDVRVATQLAAIEAGLDVCPVEGEELGDPCDACLVESCLDELSACEDDPDCACMLECDDDDEICLPECGLAQTPAALDSFFACALTNCAEACDI